MRLNVLLSESGSVKGMIMANWKKELTILPSGERVLAQALVIISASRSTDISAFYADWGMDRFWALMDVSLKEC